MKSAMTKLEQQAAGLAARAQEEAAKAAKARAAAEADNAQLSSQLEMEQKQVRRCISLYHTECILLAVCYLGRSNVGYKWHVLSATANSCVSGECG